MCFILGTQVTVLSSEIQIFDGDKRVELDLEAVLRKIFRFEICLVFASQRITLQAACELQSKKQFDWYVQAPVMSEKESTAQFNIVETVAAQLSEMIDHANIRNLLEDSDDVFPVYDMCYEIHIDGVGRKKTRSVTFIAGSVFYRGKSKIFRRNSSPVKPLFIYGGLLKIFSKTLLFFY